MNWMRRTADESRVNDIITLGATSWRIQGSSCDQVIVTPAPGRSARLPFWRGEGNGRPAELGEMIGDFLHSLWRMARSFPGLFPRGWQKKIRKRQYSGVD
ncbi:hypothetical protein ACLB1T_28530 [Escherichia coli]